MFNIAEHFKGFLMSKEEDQKSLQMLLKCMVLIDGFVQTRKKNKNKNKNRTTKKWNSQIQRTDWQLPEWGRDVTGWGW